MPPEAEVRAHIAMKATEDDAFRVQVIAENQAALEAETGIRSACPRPLAAASPASSSTRRSLLNQ